MTTLLSRLVDHAICLFLNHPPMTSIYWGGVVESEAERAAHLAAIRGDRLTVNCCCGRRQVSPIWWPRWRKAR